MLPAPQSQHRHHHHHHHNHQRFSQHPMTQLASMAAISLGASTGALLRWQLGLYCNQAGLPWGTWLANALGGYAIGLVLALLQAMPQLSPLWRLLLVTGFLGGLTTFSSYSAEVFTLLQEGRWVMAAAWALGQVLTSVLLTALGWITLQSALG